MYLLHALVVQPQHQGFSQGYSGELRKAAIRDRFGQTAAAQKNLRPFQDLAVVFLHISACC